MCLRFVVDKQKYYLKGETQILYFKKIHKSTISFFSQYFHKTNPYIEDRTGDCLLDFIKLHS